MEKTRERVKRSVKLSIEVANSLKHFVDNQPTKIDAAEALGISRVTLDRIMIIGSGKPETVEKITTFLQQNSVAA